MGLQRKRIAPGRFVRKGRCEPTRRLKKSASGQATTSGAAEGSTTTIRRLSYPTDRPYSETPAPTRTPTTSFPVMAAVAPFVGGWTRIRRCPNPHRCSTPVWAS